MSAEAPSKSPDAAEIEAELALLLASPDFQKNRGASQFLKFVVEETMAGRGDRLKAFTIATQALEHKDDFDSQSNSAVRVQALRLRQLLQAWYEGPGADHAVRIILVPGSYKPVFQRGGALGAKPAPEVATPEVAMPDRRFDWRRLAAALGLSLATFLFAMIGLMTGPASPPGSRDGNAPPIPSLRILRAPGAPKPIADLAQALEVALSGFDNIILRKPEGETDSRSTDGPAVNAYLLSLRPMDKDFAVELLRMSDNTIVWASQYVQPADRDAVSRQARELSQTLGDAYGVIDLDALRRLNDFDGMPRGFNCTLNTFAFLKIQSLDRMRVARECLEIAVGGNAKDDDARAMLAIVLVYEYFFAPPDRDPQADLRRAELLSQQAFDLAPLRARSFFARFVTLFAGGHHDEAFAAAHTALALNDNSTLFARGVGAALVLRGETDAGLALLSPLVDRTDDNSAALAAAGLAHALRGETALAVQLLARPGAQDRALGLVVQLALCGQARDAACARDPGADLRRNFPGVAANIDAALDRMGMSPQLKSRLLPDLREAGVVPPPTDAAAESSK